MRLSCPAPGPRSAKGSARPSTPGSAKAAPSTPSSTSTGRCATRPTRPACCRFTTAAITYTRAILATTRWGMRWIWRCSTDAPSPLRDTGGRGPEWGSRSPARGVPELRVPRLDPVLDALGPRRRAVGAERLTVRDGQHVVLERRLEGTALALDVHRLVHRRLGQLEGEGILQRDAPRQLERGVGQRGAWHHPVDEAELARRGRVDVVAGEEVLLGLPRPEIPRHAEVLHVRAAPAHRPVGDQRVIGGDDEDATGSQHEP